MITLPLIKDILKAIYADIIKYGSDYIDNGLYLGIVLALIYFGVKLFCRALTAGNNKERLWRIIFKMMLVVVLAVYGYAIAGITVLSRTPGTITAINLGMGDTFSWKRQSLIFIVENVLMMIPLGLLLPLLWRRARNFFICLSAGLFVSLLIESAQYLWECGMFQTDDLITNAAGTVIGFIICWIVGKLFRKLLPKP